MSKTHYWNGWDQMDWTLRGPSRRLKSLYGQLQLVEEARDAVRRSNPCPEHAPTSLVLIRQRLRPLDEHYYDLLTQIARLQNDEDV